jgi:hypothetical protein
VLLEVSIKSNANSENFVSSEVRIIVVIVDLVESVNLFDSIDFLRNALNF